MKIYCFNAIKKDSSSTIFSQAVAHLKQSCLTSIPAAMVASSMFFSGLQVASSQENKGLEDEDVYVLSPFVVNAEEDEGFIASQSLAGGRLAGDLMDTPAAYSVLTKEFIDAVGITDLEEAAQWVPGASDIANVEQATDAGRYSSGVATSISTRGTNNAIPQKNFFPFGSVYDSYNIERFDFSRGPNSILFGNGSIGGSANVVTKRARLGSNEKKLTYRLGSWNYNRASLDYNVMVNDKLAFRINTLWQDADAYRKHEYHKVDGIALAGIYKIAENTEFRVEGERTRTRRVKGQSYFRDKYSAWDGVTVYDQLYTGKTIAKTGTRRQRTGSGRTGSGYYVFSPTSGYDGLVDWTRAAQTTGSGELNGALVGGQVLPASRRNLNFHNGRPIRHSDSRPSYINDIALTNSNFFIPADDFAVVSKQPSIDSTGKDITASLTHSINHTWFFELAANHSEVSAISDLTSVRGGNEIYIDVNRNMPNGDPNPNFLEPYADIIPMNNLRDTKVDNFRFSAAYRKELSWVDFSTNIMLSSTDMEVSRKYNILSTCMNDDPRVWGGQNIVRMRSYYNRDYIVDYNDVLGQQITAYDPFKKVEKTVTPRWVPFTNSARAESNSKTHTSYKNLVAAFNAKFFDRRLVVLGALRHDKYEYYQQFGVNQGEESPDWDGVTLNYRPVAASEKDYFGLTYFPKDAAGNIVGPELSAAVRPRKGLWAKSQYENDVFMDDFSPPKNSEGITTYSLGSVLYLDKNRLFSAFVNYAESFEPPPTLPTYFWNWIPAGDSSGWDYGLRAQLLDRKLILSVGMFDSTQLNNRVGSLLNTGAIRSLYNANKMGDDSDNGVNDANLPPIPAPNSDVRHRYADGIEISATANLTKSWRLIGNYSTHEVESISNSPISRQWVEENDSLLRQVVLDTGALIDSDNVAVVNPDIEEYDEENPLTTASRDRNGAIGAWNNLQSSYGRLIHERSLEQKSQRLNLYTDYRFRDGIVKGLRIGAGMNYQFGRIIGHRGSEVIEDPNNPGKMIDNPAVDMNDKLYSDDYYKVVLNISYSWALTDKIDASISLKVDNLLDDTSVIYRNSTLRPPNGDVTSFDRVTVGNQYEVKRPRSFTLTSSFSF